MIISYFNAFLLIWSYHVIILLNCAAKINDRKQIGITNKMCSKVICFTCVNWVLFDVMHKSCTWMNIIMILLFYLFLNLYLLYHHNKYIVMEKCIRYLCGVILILPHHPVLLMVQLEQTKICQCPESKSNFILYLWENKRSYFIAKLQYSVTSRSS